MAQPIVNLADEVIAFTGANSDLAAAVASAAYEAGARLALSSRNLPALEQWIASRGFEDDRVLALAADVTSEEDLARVMDRAAERFGKLDGLMTFAGVQIRKAALELTREDWSRVLDVNLSGTFFACQAAARHMVPAGKGRIVLISSLTAEIGLPRMAAYVASRGGVRQLARALAVEWAARGVTVNSVGPGRIRTSMTEELFADPAAAEAFLRCIPAGRAGTPEDIVGLCLLLCSDASAYVTGQSFYVDGGWLAAGGSATG